MPTAVVAGAHDDAGTRPRTEPAGCLWRLSGARGKALGAGSFSLLLALLFIAVACKPPPEAETYWWEPDPDGFIRFSTNDETYLNHAFASWTIPYVDPMDRVEVRMRKLSGNPWGAYGLLFCLQNIHGFYLLAIDTKGFYEVARMAADTWTDVVSWTYTDSLNQGYEATNVLAVSYESTSKTFTIELNGDAVASFVDWTYSGGFSGFYAEVMTQEYESFPSEPVDVRFRFACSAGICVYPTAGLQTTESGGADAFQVKLDTRPTGKVAIGLSSSDLGAGTANPSSLVFTPEDWSVPQTVTVTGVDDALLDGDTEYTIVTAPASSADPAYQGLDAADVGVTCRDDEESPSAPSGLTACAVSNLRIDLSWTDTSAIEDGFGIERKLGFTGAYVQIAEVEADSTAYSDESVAIKANTIYIYRVRARRDTGGSGYSNEALVVQRLTDPNAQAGDCFGGSVAIGGDYAVAASKARSLVYRRFQANTWELSTTLAVAGAVSISGDYVVVAENGMFHVFHRTGTDSWDAGTQVAAPENDWITSVVAVDGDYVVAGNTGAYDYNYAYVFHRTGENSWDAGTKIVAPDGTSLDGFGSSVAISGDYLAVGAPRAYVEGAEEGAVYVFRRTGDNAWDSVVKLISPSVPSGEDLGAIVAISGDYLIAASRWSFTGYHNQVYVFHRLGTDSWDSGVRLEAADAPVSGDQYGCSVAISGDFVVVGARWDEGEGYAAGAAYVFERLGLNSWDTGTRIVAPDAAAVAEFGSTASVSGSYVIVGAPSADQGESKGAVYIFY